ncbi:MAG: adenylosuccinate synthetase, partial [Rhizobacter sp.]
MLRVELDGEPAHVARQVDRPRAAGHRREPHEDTAALGELLRERGGEYGSVTRRSRRCGWMDLPLLRYSAAINGI